MSEVPDVIREIAEKIGTTAEAAWPLYCDFIRADAVAPMVGCGIAFSFVLFGACAAWVIAWRLWGDLAEEGKVAMTLIPGVIVMLVGLFCGGVVSEHLAAALQPQGAAIDRVVHRVMK